MRDNDDRRAAKSRRFEYGRWNFPDRHPFDPKAVRVPTNLQGTDNNCNYGEESDPNKEATPWASWRKGFLFHKVPFLEIGDDKNRLQT
jgi:hypothetical protein